MEEITELILKWYQENKRELPWRQDADPYHVWISEIMLQQTRVEAVKEYYKRFLQVLPNIASLAAVEDDVLMKLWQGLGYYNRARNLKKAAVMIMEEHDGSFPEGYEKIIRLPGIGVYTAGAVASIAFGERVPAVDGNVYRIYTRLTEEKEDISKPGTQKMIRQEIWKLMPEEKPGDFNQAMMDLGAGICLPNGEPLCGKCPLKKKCQAERNGTVLEYPHKAPKKERRIEEKTVFILEYEGKYLLQKRPDHGLLAGLWEFPVQEGNLNVEEAAALFRQWGETEPELELLGKAKHVFTHIEWRMIGYMVRIKKLTPDLEEGFLMVTKEELKEKYSIPSAYSAYLKVLYA